MKRKVSDILTRDVTTITLEDSLAHAAKLMSDKCISCIIAIKNHKPVGILTEADLVHICHLNIDAQHTTLAEHLSQPVLTINAEEQLYDAFECMLEHHVRHLIVVSADGHLQGLLTFTDILKAAEFDDFMKAKLVSDEMSRNIAMLTPSDPLQYALKSMDKRHLSCVVIVEEEHAVGIFSERDAVNLIASGDDLSSLIMSDVMSSPVITMKMDGTLLEASELMHQHHFRRIVIIDDEQLPVGILTQFDVIRGLEGKRVMDLKKIFAQTDTALSEVRTLLFEKSELERRYRSLFEESRDMMHIINVDGRIIAVNQAELDVLGYSREEMIGKLSIELLAPDALEITLQSLKKVMQGAMIPLTESVLLTKTGERLHVEVSATPQFENGKVVSVLGILRDITERKQKDALLERRERQLAVLAEAGKTINETIDETKIIRNLVDLGRQLMACKSGAVGLYHDGSTVFSEYAINSQYHAIDYTFLPGYGVPGHVMNTRQPYISNDTIHDPHVIPEIQQTLGFKKLINMPILDADDEMLGCFEMHDRWDDADFDAQDLEMIQILSGIVSAALVNARLLKASLLQQQQIQQSAERMHAMLNNIPFLAWLKDDQGRFLIANDNLAKACGVTNVAALIGKTDLDIWPEEEAESFRQTDQQVMDSAKPLQVTRQVHTPEGKFWFETFKSPLFNSKREIVGTAGMSLDISQRIETEQTMMLLENAVSAINESIIITNPEGTIVYVNPAFTRNTGYSSDDAVGKTPAILNSQQQSAKFYQYFWQTLKAGKPWSGRILDRRKDGTIFPVNLSVAPIFGANAEITHFVAVHEDLSPYENLQKKMIQTQKMEAVGIMAGGMAHDFNNLLATLTGNLYLMRSHHKDNEEIVRRSKNMDVSIQHGAKMIQQMLTFARKNSMAMHNIDLQSFIKEAHKMTQAALPEDVKLTLNYDGEVAWIHGDPSQLQQVILNLVANACHAIKDSDNPHVRLELNHEEPPASLLIDHAELSSDYGWCCIRCHDNGCGISTGNLEHIFEPFFTTREVGIGTGLGLAMVYGAVQSHRGIIDVQSIEDEGTAFSIYLPLCKVGKAKVIDNDDYIIEGNNRGILVVDDDEQLREVLVHVLRYNGFKVWEAADGELAISQYRKFKEKLSLVMMDIVMPNMGGVAAAQEIRAIDPALPIIFLTGYGEEAQLNAAASIQRSKALRKPIAMSDLIKTIEKMIPASFIE